MPVHDARPVDSLYSENALEVRNLAAGGRVRNLRGKLSQLACKSDIAVRRRGLRPRMQIAGDPLRSVLVLGNTRLIEAAEDLREG